jgi:hypothetical protein
MFDKYIYGAVIIFVFLISFLAAVGTPNMIVELFRNLFSFVVMTTVLTVIFITFSPLLSTNKQNNDFLYY